MTSLIDEALISRRGRSCRITTVHCHRVDARHIGACRDGAVRVRARASVGAVVGGRGQDAVVRVVGMQDFALILATGTGADDAFRGLSALGGVRVNGGLAIPLTTATARSQLAGSRLYFTIGRTIVSSGFFIPPIWCVLIWTPPCIIIIFFLWSTDGIRFIVLPAGVFSLTVFYFWYTTRCRFIYASPPRTFLPLIG